MQHEELLYTLPDILVVDAVKRAVDVLQAVAKVDSGCLYYVIQPSNVLALSGLRAQSPYNEFAPTFNKKRQKALQRILRSHGFDLLPSTSPYADEQRDYFSVICPEMFERLPEQYGAVHAFWKKPHKYDDLADFEFWSEYFEGALVELMSNNQLPKQWLRDWWVPHNLRFGMLLGYPGQALSSFCWNEARYAEGKEVEQGTSAELPYQGLYNGTHVTYDYAAQLQDHPVLQAHQALWANVLHGVYSAFSETRMMGLAKFNREFEKFKDK